MKNIILIFWLTAVEESLVFSPTFDISWFEPIPWCIFKNRNFVMIKDDICCFCIFFQKVLVIFMCLLLFKPFFSLLLLKIVFVGCLTVKQMFLFIQQLFSNDIYFTTKVLHMNHVLLLKMIIKCNDDVEENPNPSSSSCESFSIHHYNWNSVSDHNSIRNLVLYKSIQVKCFFW